MNSLLTENRKNEPTHLRKLSFSQLNIRRWRFFKMKFDFEFAFKISVLISET